eukprot:TRINITY_DN9797_c0_g1_i1.p1 TRINITY_DN9797_c0_g1~~TRINITY_DN9797_c0_g1_i1.p1  ORF type:complete len:98 (-),score=11.57 TRINITY_DN9797_c0_g1_i1:489-782(-)
MIQKILSIIRSNGISNKDRHTQVFPIISRLNHSRIPNVEWTFAKSNTLEVTALRDIYPRQQLFASYLHLEFDTRIRTSQSAGVHSNRKMLLSSLHHK